MRKKRRGLEVQFMDSIDSDISADKLQQQLHDAFHADDASAQNFIDSVFKPSENSKYDIDFRKVSRDLPTAKEHTALAKNQYPVKDMRPKRNTHAASPRWNAYWLKKICLTICYKFCPKNNALDRWQNVARK